MKLFIIFICIVTIIALLVAIWSSTPNTKEPAYTSPQQQALQATKEFEDCSMVTLDLAKGVPIYIVRCPSSTTSTNYRHGKSLQTTSTITP